MSSKSPSPLVELAATAVVAAIGAAFRLPPRSFALKMGEALGRAFYYTARRRRTIAKDNLRLSLGSELSEDQIEQVAKASFVHLGNNFAEVIRFPVLADEKLQTLVEVSGEEHLEQALAQGHGVFGLTAHVGSFDLQGPFLVFKGYPMALISKVPRLRAVARFWMKSRHAKGVHIISGKGTLRETLKFLKAGGVVGFVLDQNALPGDGIFVPFFGRPACTLTTLAVLARRTGAPVVPIHTYREGNAHRLVIEPALVAPPVSDREQDVLERTKSYAEWTEQIVRRHPTQWTWLHNRWKTQPVGTAPTATVP